MAAAGLVEFECVAEGSRLRVRIVTPGYAPGANCQFPRAIRAAGARFVAEAAAVHVAQSRGRYFYRVTPGAIRVLAGAPPGVADGAPPGLAARPAAIFADDDPTCSVCLDAPKSLVFIPCGHYHTCADCFAGMQRSAGAPLTLRCPICRQQVAAAVDRALLD